MAKQQPPQPPQKPTPPAAQSQNPEEHTCPTCGYVWKHGLSGEHNCATLLKVSLERAASRIDLIQGIQGDGMPEPWRTRVCNVIANGVDNTVGAPPADDPVPAHRTDELSHRNKEARVQAVQLTDDLAWAGYEKKHMPFGCLRIFGAFMPAAPNQGRPERTMREVRIVIPHPMLASTSKRHAAEIGDWIVLHRDGLFTVHSDEEFNEEFEALK